jgi:RNA-directed DNA polymerase
MHLKSLEKAFNTMFHNPQLFEEFLGSDLSNEVEEFYIGKEKPRKVIRVSDKFKTFLRFIDKIILQHLKINDDVVHSYIKERSAMTAVQSHVDSKYFLVSDIVSFFSNVNSEDVKKILVANVSNIPIADIEHYIPRIVTLVCWNDCLPVGFVTSPKLSNAALFHFDSAMADYCKKHSLTYTRYSDDLIVSSQTREPLIELQTQLQSLISQNTNGQLEVNLDKTRIYTIGQPFTILGLVITQYQTLTISRKHKNHLEVALHYFVTDKLRFQDYLEEHFAGKEQSLFGLLHYAKSVEPRYINKLQRKYGAYAITDLLENKWND